MVPEMIFRGETAPNTGRRKHGAHDFRGATKRQMVWQSKAAHSMRPQSKQRETRQGQEQDALKDLSFVCLVGWLGFLLLLLLFLIFSPPLLLPLPSRTCLQSHLILARTSQNNATSWGPTFKTGYYLDFTYLSLNKILISKYQRTKHMHD